jgi:hypothetical protein
MRPVEQIRAAAVRLDSTRTAAFVLVREAVIGR